jgi:hypothetical protein
MPKKIAVFVEGLTEQEFTIRLLEELVGNIPITFNVFIQTYGNLSFVEAKTNAPGGYNIEVLVANCCHDDQVKSQINDQYKKLVSNGYTTIIGLRDVYPLLHKDIPNLRKDLSKKLVKGTVPIIMHLSILETEAWFLEELTHYEKIDPDLGLDKVIANGFDYVNTRAADLPHPTETLDNIYKSVNKRYISNRNKKNKNKIRRTVNALSYENLYEVTQHIDHSLHGFIESLERSIF